MPVDTSFNSVYNFIVNFKPEEIDEIIYDWKLKEKGYKFLYAVDTYDIMSHYLPFTEGDLFQHDDKNNLAQKLICYDYFFNLGIENSVIILDEYKIELLSAKNKIQRQLKDTKLVIQNLDFLKKQTLEFTKLDSTADEFFEKNFELFLMLLVLNEKKDFIHTEFDIFLKNKLSVIEIKTGNPEDDKLLNGVFESTGHSKLTQLLFAEFIDANKLDLVSIEKPVERYVYLENTYRDIQAVDRLLAINNKLKINGNKFVILYLSSTPFKTREIFKNLKTLDKASNLVNSTSPDFNSLLINRNIYQCFLFDILNNEFSNEEVNIVEALESLRNLAGKLKKKGKVKLKNEVHLDSKDIKVFNKLKNIFDIYSANLDNHFYLKIYEKYKAIYDTVNPRKKNLKEKRPEKDKDILRIYSLVDTFLNKENFKQKLFDLSFTITQLKQAVEITNVFNKSKPLIPNVHFGKDVIKNNFHHLPYLIFIWEEINSRLINGLYRFLNELIEITYPSHSGILRLQDKLKEVVNELSDDNRDINIMCLQQIVIAYINLITIPSEEDRQFSSNESGEEEIIEGLEKQKQIFNSVKMDSQVDQKSNGNYLNVDFVSNIYSNEIDYILLWLYRRNNRILEGIELGKKMVSNYPDDARYHHGLALCYISSSYKELFDKNITDAQCEEICEILENAFGHLLLAKENYEVLFIEPKAVEVNLLVEKNYIAILNSLADISLRKYRIKGSKDEALLQDARNYFELLKIQFSGKEIPYYKYVTFVGTETEILYFEANSLFETKHIKEAHQKILEALQRSSILEKSKVFDISHPKFRETQHLIKGLSLKIFKKVR